MSSLLQADIFFFITSIAVIVSLVVVIVIGYYVFKLVRHAEYIAKKIRDESDNIAEDIAYLRANIKDRVEQTNVGIGGVFRFISNLCMPKTRSSARTTGHSTYSTKNRSKTTKESEDKE